MRICLLYDCLYPYTVGGAERWYRDLARRLVAEGHEVTYLTLRQWERGEKPDGGKGVRVVAVGPRLPLYTAERRRILPPLLFGLGVLLHLLRHGRRYDAVHTASFPYFSLLAAGAVRPLGRYQIVVDWHEFWSKPYWETYLGGLRGRIGYRVQKLCTRVPQRAFCFSSLYARRLVDEGLRGPLTVLTGQHLGDLPLPPAPPDKVRRSVVFAGRMIPEKRALLALEAFALAQREERTLRAAFYGEGPEREALLARIRALGLTEVVEAPGFVDRQTLARAFAGALCLLLPSAREGYGKVVVEAAALGTPALLVAGPDNAATELVEDGVNGYVVAAPEPALLAQAILRILARGAELRRSTATWYERRREELSLERSLEAVLRSYRATANRRAPA